MIKSGNIAGIEHAYKVPKRHYDPFAKGPKTRDGVARPDLSALVEEWRNRLSLRDWDIAIKYVDWEELSDDEKDQHTLGRVWMTPHRQMATIRIADPLTFPLEDIETLCVLMTVIHELIHLKLSMLITVDNEDHCALAALEVVVHHWSIALVDLVGEVAEASKPKRTRKVKEVSEH